MGAATYPFYQVIYLLLLLLCDAICKFFQEHNHLLVAFYDPVDHQHDHAAGKRKELTLAGDSCDLACRYTAGA